MKTIKILLSGFFIATIFLAGCKTMNKSQKGAVIGAAGGAAAPAADGTAPAATTTGRPARPRAGRRQS